MRALLACVVALAAGCVGEKSLTCDDGRICPAGSRCDDANHRCLTDQQLAACAGMPDGADCTDSGVAGTCVTGACIPAVCGDGVRTAGEVCDGTDLAGQTCETRGYYAQTTGLACTPDCKFDESGCEQRCGDGVRNGTEQCDGSDLGGDCQTAGFYNAAGLTCTSFCTWNVSQCTGRCGDGIINGGEICDGAPPPNGCLAYDFDFGTIGCSLCAPEYSHCGHARWFPDTVLTPDLVLQVSATSTADTWVTGFSSFAMHRSGTTWTTYTLPSETSNGSIWNRGMNDVFVSGRKKVGLYYVPTVDHFDGTSFTQVVLPGVGGAVNEQTLSISGLANGEGFAVSDHALYHFDGTSWSMVTAVTPAPNKVWAASTTDVWIVRGDSTVQRWNGAGFTQVTDFPAAASTVQTVWGIDSTHVYVGFINGLAILNGSTWTFRPGSAVSTIDGRSTSDVVALGDGGYAIKFDGSHWYDISGVGVNATKGSVVDLGGQVLVPGANGLYVIDGSVWLNVPNWINAGGNSVYGIWSSGAMSFLATYDGILTVDESNTWTQSTMTNAVNAVFGFSTTDVWTTDGGSLYHFTGGASWDPYTAPHSAVAGIWGTSSTDLWLVSLDGLGGLYVDRGDGTTWTPSLSTTSTSNVAQIRGSSANDVWIATGTDTLQHWNGSSWSPVVVPGTPQLTAVWSFGPSSVVAVGWSGAIYMYDGVAWTKQVTNTSFILSDVWGRAANDIFVVGNQGTILHYDGATWTPVRDPRDGANILAVYGTADHLALAREDVEGGDVLYQFAPWH